MMRERTAWRFTAATAAAIIAVTLGGCGSVDPTEWLSGSGTDARPVTGQEGGFTVTQGDTDAPSRRTVTASDLVGPDGSCEGASPGQAVQPRGVGLTMTECELVAAAGVPDQINIGADGGERRVVLTYSKGDHPGIYTFVSGRLKIIERLPTAAKPERRRRAPKKPRA